MNPHGRVPVLRDGETAMWESNTIVRYLCGAYSDGRLCPIEAKAKAQTEAWMDWTLATLQPAIMGLFWSFYRAPVSMHDPALIGRFTTESAQAIRMLDAWLETRPFIAGDFSMADIPAGTLMHRYFNLGIERPTVLAVEAWRKRLAQRAPYQACVMRPFGELFGRTRD
jgi:glutathione S-transferase